MTTPLQGVIQVNLRYETCWLVKVQKSLLKIFALLAGSPSEKQLKNLEIFLEKPLYIWLHKK